MESKASVATFEKHVTSCSKLIASICYVPNVFKTIWVLSIVLLCTPRLHNFLLPMIFFKPALNSSVYQCDALPQTSSKRLPLIQFDSEPNYSNRANVTSTLITSFKRRLVHPSDFFLSEIFQPEFLSSPKVLMARVPNTWIRYMFRLIVQCAL
jgi:hypothetical protein